LIAEPAGKWQVSTGGGTQPRWRQDGKELYFIATDKSLMAVTVAGGAQEDQCAGFPRISQAQRCHSGLNMPYPATADFSSTKQSRIHDSDHAHSELEAFDEGEVQLAD
jgi:hypothetical protein